MNPPPYLISQQGRPSLPSTDDLEEAVLWDYRFTFVQRWEAGFETTLKMTLDVTYNDERTVQYTVALEDADGIAQVRVTAASGELPLVLIGDTRLVAMADAYRYEVADGSLLAYADVADQATYTVLFDRLDVIDVQSVRPAVSGVSFDEPLIPYVENRAPLPIGGTRGTLAEHLTWLFDTLLGNSPFAAQPASIECRYAYELGGMPIEAPVVLVTRQDFAIGFDEALIEQIAGAIRQWLDAVQPPSANARLVLGLAFWCALPRTNTPLLHLPNVVLPMADVT